MHTLKYNRDGTIQRDKARLVARGFTTSEGTIILRHSSCKVEFYEGNTIAAISFKNAFLHEDLEEVYIELSPRLILKGQNGKICHLEKAFYGLKQSPQPGLIGFLKLWKEVVDVNYIVVIGNDTMEIQNLKKCLGAKI